MKPSLGIGIVAVAAVSVASLLCEWVIARLVGGSALVPPVATLATILVMQGLSFPASIGYGLAAGFLIDSVALPPFGATIILFIFLACAREGVLVVMADHKSHAAKIAMVAGMYAIAYGVAPLARTAAALLGITPL